MEHKKILQLTQCALIAALAYVGFQFLRIDIPVGTERTAIHLGNTFVVIGALLLGGWGGFAGAMGLTMADLTSGYITSAPKTFLLKLAIGLITTLLPGGSSTLRRSPASRLRPGSPSAPPRLRSAATWFWTRSSATSIRPIFSAFRRISRRPCRRSARPPRWSTPSPPP